MRLLPLALLFAAAAVAPADAQTSSPMPARVHFEFHSGFLMNLHHTLFNLATHPDRADAFLARATPAEAADLQAALAFYRDHYAGRDLLFDKDMAAIKRALSVGDDARRDPLGLGLPPDLAEVLARAAPAYARIAWAEDDAGNRAWIARERALDGRYGARVQAAIERGLGAPFPATPIRVDLVLETGTRPGAYTDEQTVIPTGRPSYQDLAGFEMLYHEAAHVQTSDRIERAIAARAAAQGRDPDSELWHVLHFYTVGAAVTEALAADHIAYVQYAQERGLYAGPWAAYMASVENDWKPHLAGREPEDVAIERMVARLPAAKAAK